MANEAFSWERFLRSCKLTEKSPAALWRERMADCLRIPQRAWAMRFMGLVHFFEPRDGETGKQAAARISGRYFDFAYDRFYGNDKLRDGLDEIGIRLRVDNNRHVQYVRTIHYYSGWMYVKFARTIARAVGKFSWEKIAEHDTLLRLLEHDIKRFQRTGDSSEEELSREDVVAFFQSLTRLYRRYNAPFSVEDVQELAPLKRSVAQRIIDEMCEASDGGSLQNLETRPQIALDEHGRAVFSLPQKGHFAEGTDTVVFAFRDAPDSSVPPFAHAIYHRTPKGDHALSWDKPREYGSGVPCRGRRIVRSITRFEPAADKPQVEVIPQIFLDSERTHLLLRLRDSAQAACGYELDANGSDAGIVSTRQKLSAGTRCQILPLTGCDLNVAVMCRGERSPLPVSANGVLTIPGTADELVVGEDVYEVRTFADSYLNMDNRCRHFRHPGRLFFERSCDPFTDVCRAAGENLSVRYLFDDGGNPRMVPMPLFGVAGQTVPEEVLWKKGSLEVRENGTSLFRRAVTFTEDLDVRAFERPLDLEADARRIVVVGDERLSVDVPPRIRRIEIPCHGFTLSLPIRRTGVYFECANTAIPIPRERPGASCARELARSDFERLKCCIATESDADDVFVTRGNTALVRLDDRRFTGGKLLADETLQETNSDHFAICVRHEGRRGPELSFYKFHLYDPQRTNVANAGENPHSVTWRRDSGTDDLVLTYWIAFSDCNRQKHLAFFPAHRQDESPVVVESAPKETYVHMEDEPTGRCRETIRVPGFFGHDMDWGHGLICFVVHRKTYFGDRHDYDVLSSGFFLNGPVGKRTEIENDPYGLRAAFAGNDGLIGEDGDKILQVMTSNDSATQGYVAGFLDRMKDATAELNVFTYLNAYWNKMPRHGANWRPSGYAFMAGAYFAKVFSDEVAAEPYRSLWSRLLIGYRHLKPQSQRLIRKYLPRASHLDKLPVALKFPFWQKVRKVLGHTSPIGHFMFTRNHVFSYPQLAEAVRRACQRGTSLRELQSKIPKIPSGDRARNAISELYSAWMKVARGELDVEEIAWKSGTVYRRVHAKLPRGNLGQYGHIAFEPAFDGFADSPSLFYGGYEDGLKEIRGNEWSENCCLSDNDVEEFIETMGLRLHNWRLNPTLGEAQGLRELFVFLESVDAHVNLLPDRKSPRLGLLEGIENEAWLQCKLAQKTSAKKWAELDRLKEETQGK